MAVKFQDYYETLGVDRKATQDEIRRAYRKLARKYHPDVNSEKGAEDKFKGINEANEVLKDPEKRKLYDQLGADWKAGQDFKPPRDWEDVHFAYRGAPPKGEDYGFGGGFSDFFETIFGGRPGGRTAGAGQPAGWAMRGLDHEAEIVVTLDEAFRGGLRTVTLQGREVDPQGRLRSVTKTYKVRIPEGVTDGGRIRLPGKGGEGMSGGTAGDLYLRVHIEPHPTFRLEGHDLRMEVPVTPWEAALGATVEVPVLDGTVSLKIPPGVQSGQKLRLKGKGFPKQKGGRGALLARVKIVVPEKISPEERELFEALARTSSFDPRAK